MRLPKKARSTLSLLAVLAGSALAACAGDATAPVQAGDALAPGGASHAAAVNTSNGTYTFTVDPTRSNGLTMGQHKLNIPANGICDLVTSGYGPSTWNTSCSPQTSTLTITAVVTTSTDGHPQIDFSPALRFNPATTVSLYMWDAKASAGTARKYTIAYCAIATAIGTTAGCVDEAAADPDLQTKFVAGTYYLYRQIKHFSGYIVVGVTEEAAPAAL